GKIPQDRLPAAHVRGKGAEEGDLVSLGGKIVAGLLREAVLQLDVAAFKGTFGESRSLQRRLNVHLEIHEIRDELRVRLRLVPAAHDAERHAKIALLRKPRDDGVAGTLAAGQRVGRAGVQREERSAIVQRKARFRCDNPGAKFACSGSISFALCVAHSFESSACTGNFWPRGSPMYRAMSA